MSKVMMLHDLVDPDDPQGRTYKQINEAKRHQIPIGTLVELESGARLFVVHHGRDCDMTPLYYMCYDRTDTERRRSGFKNSGWTGGYPEYSLTVVSGDAIAVECEACAAMIEQFRDSLEYDTSMSDVFVELDGIAATIRARGEGTDDTPQ